MLIAAVLRQKRSVADAFQCLQVAKCALTGLVRVMWDVLFAEMSVILGQVISLFCG